MAAINRTLSFFSKWLAEVLRQPWLMLSLVVGPFAILLAFGQGVKVGVPHPRTYLVIPPGADPKMVPPTRDLEDRLEIVGETDDVLVARRALRNGDVDMVAVLPPRPMEAIQAGRRADIRIITNEIDPVVRTYANAYLREQVGLVNQRTLENAIRSTQESLNEAAAASAQARQATQAMRAANGDPDKTAAAQRDLQTAIAGLDEPSGRLALASVAAVLLLPGYEQQGNPGDRLSRSVRTLQQLQTARAAGGVRGGSPPTNAELDQTEALLDEIDASIAQVQAIPAWVLSAPFELQLENIAPTDPDYIGFYGPAVLALLLQHLAVTLGALSMARIRLIGLMELLQVSPVRPSEVVTGNYLSYGSLCAVAGAILVALLTYVLGVPVVGAWWQVIAILILLVLTGLGVGFVISMLASSEQQAAQLAMLVLIASVFFSGFVVALNTIIWPVRAISFGLPATYAIRSLQNVMLRGQLRQPIDVAVLGVAALTLALFTVLLFRREYRPR